jgi:hypothetical protein
MLSLALALALSAPATPIPSRTRPPGQEQDRHQERQQDRDGGDGAEREDYDPAVIEAAVTELDRVFATRVEGAIVSALLRYRELEHPDVIARVAGALRHRKAGVRRTAIEVLRWMEHEDALAALEKSCREDERLRRDADLLSRTLRAIGQHADPSSLDLFASLPFESKEEDVVRARIRGLGRIRSVRAVDALLALMDTEEGWDPIAFAPDFRLSLQVLTGVDRGVSPSGWKRWREECGDELEVSPKLPELPREARIDWCTYWDLPLEIEEPEGGARGGRKRVHEEEERRG